MHLFISYAKKDTRELALALAEALNAIDGITAWVDKTLRAGRSWEIQIQSEIDRCDAMIVLYSPDINRHKLGQEESYVLTEISYAKYTAKKPIIPVMAVQTAPPISLTTVHYIDFTIDGLTLPDLVDALCSEFGIATPAVVPSKPTVEPTKSVQPAPSRPPEILQEAIERARIFRGERPSAPDILPQPFDWIDIPVGKVKLVTGLTDKRESYLKSDTVFDVPTFAIVKYPITNAQYAKFIYAGGYKQKKWWTDAGWAMREEENWTEPRYWTDPIWNGARQPVVGVSWYEAVAFCFWLSEISQNKIMLPTDQQWQRAAQGDDDRIYPWGNDWDTSRCNNYVDRRGIGKTTDVMQYEGKGDSPFKVVDLAGNMWEWCLTAYGTGSQEVNGTDIRVLRGGSWGDIGTVNFRVTYRIRGDPYSWSDGGGFRPMRSLE